ncbi:hypothetical protein C6558_35815 [Ensifer sp. NM-2]|nr:hypothetical protein C6558_35815 [Ensifer sp. NM-2]
MMNEAESRPTVRSARSVPSQKNEKNVEAPFWIRNLVDADGVYTEARQLQLLKTFARACSLTMFRSSNRTDDVAL